MEGGHCFWAIVFGKSGEGIARVGKNRKEPIGASRSYCLKRGDVELKKTGSKNLEGACEMFLELSKNGMVKKTLTCREACN